MGDRHHVKCLWMVADVLDESCSFCLMTPQLLSLSLSLMCYASHILLVPPVIKFILSLSLSQDLGHSGIGYWKGGKIVNLSPFFIMDYMCVFL